MSDVQELDDELDELNLERLSSPALASRNQSSTLIQINASRQAMAQSSNGISQPMPTALPDSDVIVPNSADNSPSTRGETSAKKKPKRPSHGKPSSALMQAKLKAQAQLRKSNAGDEITVVLKDHFQPARDAKDITRGRTALVYDLRMVEHRNLWDPKHIECPERFSSILHRCENLKLLDRCLHLTPRPATEKEILTLHKEELIHKLKEVTSKHDVDAMEEFAANYDSVYFHPSTYELALLACGSTIDLVNSILAGKAQNGMAIVRPPGHHAMKSEFCGFCYFNNVALAAHSALSNGSAKKILIVDFDAHHGQATQQMFYNDPRVLYFSTHRYEYGKFWPNLEESDYHWIGDEAGLGYNCNIPLNATGLGNTEFLGVWHHVLMPIAYQFNPDLVIVSAGYDAALGCPEGHMRIHPQCYPHLISPLMGLANGKVAVVLEGGYCLKSLSEGAALTLRTLLGDPCPVIQPISSPAPILVDAILNSTYMLRKHWDLGTLHSSEDATATPTHVPTVKFEWTEPKPTKYPTKDYLPESSEEYVSSCNAELDRLIWTTSLVKAPHRVGLVYDNVMLKHRNMIAAHPECPERTSNIHSCHVDFGLIERCLKIESREATDEELKLIHTDKHILKMKNTQKLGSKDLINMQNTFNSIFFNSNTYESALHAAGSVLQVVDKVMNGECQSGVAIVRPPGHHAESDEPCGFCIFNNVALAGKYALITHDVKRILILDWDIHHGNGIQRMFEDDPRVLYISIHRYDYGAFFPGSTEASHTSVGTGKGEGFNINIPWNKSGFGDTEYLFAFHNVVLPVAYEFAPELVLVSAGFDAGLGDPLGGCKVTPEGFAHMTHLLSPLANGKLVLALEGGYNLRLISYAMTLCTKTLLGDPIPPLTLNSNVDPSAVDSVRSVLNTHSKYWTMLEAFQKILPEIDTIVPGNYRETPEADEDAVSKLLEDMHVAEPNANTADNVNDSSEVHGTPVPLS